MILVAAVLSGRGRLGGAGGTCTLERRTFTALSRIAHCLRGLLLLFIINNSLVLPESCEMLGQ